ncbi:DUF3748 domain-containing protein [Flavitalea sp.]|nr:DUF3748 domain-containing protein [Flavitalea sp.]
MNDQPYLHERQVTHDNKGHCLNSTQCFSPDGKLIVYDTRNVDSALASNGEIRVVNPGTGEDKLIYQTENQTRFGPGVGAVTFSPVDNRVLFLAGIRNADSSRPYSMTRRTGFAVDIDSPLRAIRMDARDILDPFTPGALRGGTHAHTWSGDGKWISFTYNDHVLTEAASRASKTDIINTRTVGVMFPRHTEVAAADDVENISGSMFSVLVTQVVKNPTPGSDEIGRAFDECWIGNNGYQLRDGSRQERAIAFQGELIDKVGNKKAEIFVADIPGDLISRPSNDFLPGTATTLPSVPNGVKQRRISFTGKGVSTLPRHWLRSTPDGSMIGYLAEDNKGVIQLWTISPNGGSPVQRSFLNASITGPFNFNATGTLAAFIADGSVYLTRLSDSKSYRATPKNSDKGGLVGAVAWSPVENKISYNRYVKSGDAEYLQIFTAEIDEAIFR